MRFPPFLLEEWLLRCRGARIDLDHSGAPNPMREGFDPCVGGEAWLNEFEVEDQLYKAISSAYGVKRERVALSCGAQSANFLFLLACLERKDKVAVERPTYSPIEACAQALCGGCLAVPRGREQAYQVDLDALRASLRRGAKALALTNLHNPSARAIGDDDLAAIGGEASGRGALVLVDEVYREMSYGRPPKAAFDMPNGVSTNGLSKLWGLGGLRVGWLIGPEEVAERVNEARLYSSWHLPTRAMAVAIKALKKREWFRRRVLDIAQRNLPIVRDWADGESRVGITEPQGCLHLLVHLPPGTDDELFAQRLLKRHRTAVCPGRYFGEEGSVRVTFSGEAGHLQKGLGHISDVLGRG